MVLVTGNLPASVRSFLHAKCINPLPPCTRCYDYAPADAFFSKNPQGPMSIEIDYAKTECEFAQISSTELF